MEKSKAYTAEQYAGTERAIKVLMSLPEETREMAAMMASVFVEGMIAGQGLREREGDKKTSAVRKED